jgi:Helix-turn-helix domain
MTSIDESLRLTAREIAAACESAGAPPIPPVMTLEEAATLLRIPEGTLRDWRSRGLLKSCCRKVGKHLRFFRDRLLQKVFNEGIIEHGT